MTNEDLKKYINQIIDLYHDNFIELLHNPEFQNNDLQKKEKAVAYVTILFKKQIEESFDSFLSSTSH